MSAPPSASHVSSARKMPSVPSVTMNGSMRPLRDRASRARSRTARRVPAARTMPSMTVMSGANVWPPRPAVEAVHQPDHAARDQRGHRARPTRSMPPEMITNVMPTAMMPMNDVRVSTFIALSKRGEVAVEQRAGDAQRDEAGERPERSYSRCAESRNAAAQDCTASSAVPVA